MNLIRLRQRVALVGLTLLCACTGLVKNPEASAPTTVSPGSSVAPVSSVSPLTVSTPGSTTPPSALGVSPSLTPIPPVPSEPSTPPSILPTSVQSGSITAKTISQDDVRTMRKELSDADAEKSLNSEDVDPGAL